MDFRQPDEELTTPAALFDLPDSVRRLYDELVETGNFRLPRLWYFDARPGAVPGSFHGRPATEVAAVPTDAAFARVSGRAKDVKRLATLHRLEVLDLHEVTDAALAAVRELPGLRHLNLFLFSTRSLDALRGHPGVRIVRCADAARLRNAEALATLPRLHTLWIDVSGLKDVAPLAGLAGLRNLLVTGVLTPLPTLQPLAGLTRLEHLFLGHVRIQDRSLAPLHGLRNVRSIELPDAIPLEELAALSVALPHVDGVHHSAFRAASRTFGRCRRCGGSDVVVTAGTPARTLCRGCNDAAIRKHALRWEMAVADAAVRLGPASSPGASVPVSEPLTDRPEARIPPLRRGPPPAPPAPSGEPDEPWRAAAPKLPPAWTHRIVQRFKSLDGVGAMRVENFGGLFEGGVCPACGMARGPRTAEPLRYRHSSGQEAHYDGWQAREAHSGAMIRLFSETFIALLTDGERAALEWRPAVNTTYGKKAVFELVGSRHHLPLATLRGGAPYVPTCGLCGFAPPPRYSSVTTLPRWLNPDADVNAWRGQPGLYLASPDFPDPPPACFTVGDWGEYVSLVLPAERWAQMLALGRARRPRAIQAWDVAIVPPDLTER